jgi:hypothetical protein
MDVLGRTDASLNLMPVTALAPELVKLLPAIIW